MSLDEFEAVRLADLEGLYHAQAAERMEISRATFGRILEAARRKLATVLVHGQSLAIKGGHVAVAEPPTQHCRQCDHAWQAGPESCPRCRVPGGNQGNDCTGRR